MNLECSLVLNRYLHGLFGAERFDDLRRSLKEQDPPKPENDRGHVFRASVISLDDLL